MEQNEISLGDEVFIVGLFRHHHGNRKNIPIVRVGNLASMREEKIITKDFGEMDAALIECRSIGGLSGSPVFLNLGVARIINGQFKHATGPMEFLFGLVHGHYDTKASDVDLPNDDLDADLTIDRVNTGIAIVVPFHSIDSVIKAYEATNDS
jgi:hypothetical protein